MFITSLFTMAKTWKQLKCPSIDDWIEMWYRYIMEYYSAIRKDKAMSFATTWMDLENIMLSEISYRKSQEPYDFTHVKHKTESNK